MFYETTDDEPSSYHISSLYIGRNIKAAVAFNHQLRNNNLKA